MLGAQVTRRKGGTRESRDISNGYGLGIGAGASQNNEHTGYISGICGELK